MTTMPNDEFARRVLCVADEAEGFKPTAMYDSDGDCIEFLACPDPFRAERVDDLVTVYYSQTTGEVIGSLIKGVSAFRDNLLERLPGFRIEIRDGGVRLEHIFLARMWSSDPNELVTITYEKLVRLAEETGAQTDLAPA